MISFFLVMPVKRRRFLPERITQPKIVDSADERQSDHQHQGNDHIITNHKFLFSVELASGGFTHFNPTRFCFTHYLAFTVPPEPVSKRGVNRL
jgi:hypothetical protein